MRIRMREVLDFSLSLSLSFQTTSISPIFLNVEKSHTYTDCSTNHVAIHASDHKVCYDSQEILNKSLS